MRPGEKKLIFPVILVLVGLWISGCGGSDDLLDEPGQRYRATIAIKDLDEETLSVDIIQSWCDSEAEDYGPASAAVSFTVDANAPGITLQEYILEYIPLESEDGTGTIVLPPFLDSPLRGGNLGIDIQSGGTASFDITCMSVDTKEEYRTKVGWLYYTETAGGLAAIAAKETEITNKEADIVSKNAQIDAKEDEIALETLAGNDTTLLELQLERLEEQLTDLEEGLTELESERQAMNYALWSVPELQEGRYRIRIIFKFEDEYGVSRDIMREATVWLGPYDNC